MNMFVRKIIPLSYDSDYKIELQAGYSVSDFKDLKNELIKACLYNEFYARYDSFYEALEIIDHIKIKLGRKNDC